MMSVISLLVRSARRGPAGWVLGGWVALALACVVSVTLVAPPPVSADRQLSECFRTPGASGFSDEGALLLDPARGQRRVIGENWKPLDVHAKPGLLVDRFFFHERADMMGIEEKDNRLASEVRAEWSSESDPDAVIDETKMARYEAGLAAKAGEGQVLKTAEGAAPLQNRVTTGTMVGNQPVGIVTGGGSGSFGDDGGSWSFTINTTVGQEPVVDTYTNVKSVLEHGGNDPLPPELQGEEGGPFLMTVTDPDHEHVKFVEGVDEDEGNARLVALTEDQTVDTVGDVIRVTVVVSQDYRGDPEYGGQVWPLFGDERVGDYVGLLPKQPFLWSSTGALNNSDFGLDGNGGVVDYVGNERFDVNANARGLLAGGDVRWPVYLSDMSWYLYHLPGIEKEYHWARGKERDLYDKIVGDVSPSSVFSETAPSGTIIPLSHIAWSDPTAIDLEAANPYKDQTLSVTGDIIMPFTPESAGFPHGGAELVKVGVASPEDVGGGGKRGMNSFFQFDIVEHHAYGTLPRKGLTGLGVGRLGHHWYNIDAGGTGWDRWPNGEIDPNETYVLVIAFYEGRPGPRVELRDEESDGRVGGVVTAEYRRVICRVLVQPLGVGYGEDEGGLLRRLLATVKEIGGAVASMPSNIWNAGANALFGGLGNVVEAGERGGCVAVSHLAGGGTQTSGDRQAVDGLQECEEAMEGTAYADCETGVPGCRELPTPVLTLENRGLVPLYTDSEGVARRSITLLSGDGSTVLGEGLDCSWWLGRSVGPAVCYGDEAVPRVGTGSADYIGGCLGERCLPGSGGSRFMPELVLRWEPRGGADKAYHDGYIVRVRLSPESDDLVYYYDSLGGNDHYVPAGLDALGVRRVKTYYIPRYLDGSGGGGAPVDVGLAGVVFGAGRNVEFVPGVTNVGGGVDGSDLYEFQEDGRERLVLSDGFVHEVSVATYYGSLEHDGVLGLRVSQESAWMQLDGKVLMCEALVDDPDLHTDANKSALWNGLDCEGGSVGGAVGGLGDDLVSGLQGFTGSEVCKDILTATPASMTYGLSAVREGWQISWIIAMVLIPILLFWEACRCSYGVWMGDQQVSGVVRSLAPRLLLGIVLATGSMMLSQLLISFCAQLTCYVGQATGVSLWGVMGWAFAGLFESGWFALAGVGGGAAGALGALGAGVTGGPVALVALGFAIFLIVAVVFALVFLLLLQMTVRLLVIAVLTMLSPVAFMLVLSPTTSGWTMRWMTMMLGTLFMQTVTVMVLFLGIELARDRPSGEGFAGFVVGSLMTFVVFYVATRVPLVVNGALGNVMTNAVTEVRRSVQTASLMRMASQGGRAFRR